MRKLRDDFNEKRKEWQVYVRQQKEFKYREWAEKKAQRQAEYAKRKRKHCLRLDRRAECTCIS